MLKLLELRAQDEIVGKTDFDFFDAAHARESREDEQRLMSTGEPVIDQDEREIWPDGRTTWASTTKMPMQNEAGEIVGLLGISRDITERKQDEIYRCLSGEVIEILNEGEDFQVSIRQIVAAVKERTGCDAVGLRFQNGEDFLRSQADQELKRSLHRAEELAVKAEAATRAKSEFLAVMSHELRTPLNGVLGFAELLAITPLDEDQMGFAKTITQSGEHLLSLVNDILDFSSIESDRMVIESATVILGELVESSCLSVRKAAFDKGLEFRCESAPDVPATIQGDARRLRQILINLLGNAVKFTAKGSIQFRISLAADAERPMIEFSVEDTGPGISEAMLDFVFEPFTQVDSTLHRSFEGPGIGLAISQRLAQAMGGSISLESTVDQGSVFTFHLPLEGSLG